MKTRFFLCLLTAFVVAAGRSLAADQVATVTQSVNIVDHGPSQSTTSSPAPKGTQIHDGEYVKTGASSRAELQFSNNTISRLGANTIFNYSASANEVDLQAGTILFSKPKDGKQLNIKTEAVTAAIVGTTGFLQVSHHNGQTTTLFGLIEGHANVTANGNDPGISGGQIIVITPGAPPEIFNFNVPLFLKTSLLFKGFPNDLPNQKYIDAEIAKFSALVAEGFIVIPPPSPYHPYNGLSLPPQFGLPGSFDSAGTGHYLFNQSGLSAPPTQTTCCWCCCDDYDVDFNVDIDGPHHHHPH